MEEKKIVRIGYLHMDEECGMVYLRQNGTFYKMVEHGMHQKVRPTIEKNGWIAVADPVPITDQEMEEEVTLVARH